jgi:hypothetical protein
MAYTTINKGSSYFNTVTYAGNSTDGRTLTGVGFKPDWVWIKIRSSTGGSALQDVVRGANKLLSSNSTNSESTDYSLGYLSSFTSDGFVLEQGSDPTDPFFINNVTGQTYVAWNWLGANTTVSNTSGTISSTVSANTTSGFSVVSYTGTGANATVGHGLGVAPRMIILKSRTDSDADWRVYHASVGNTGYLELNTTGATTTSSTTWQNTTPTSSVFSIGTSGTVNLNTGNFIAYCFAEVKGYSKFGSYTGNGSTNGTFIYTGFKPAFIMLKSSSSGAVGWITHDNKRIGFNPNNYYVEPNNSNAESADTDKILLLSNGFKLISTSASWNSSGGTYIYMAFAENPFVSSTGIPTTAR